MKQNTRKFYRTEIKVVILSEQPVNFNNLSDVHYAITEGECSGEWNVTKTKELTGKQAVKELAQQGSEAGFFQLNEDGSEEMG